MAKIWRIGFVILLIVAISAALYLKTPTPAEFDENAAVEVAHDYDARIIRDAFGVPHIYARRDEDVAFGLAFAHAEDDWKTIEEVVLFSRGVLARYNGRSGVITDFLIGALGIQNDVIANFDQELSSDTKAIVEGYAAGLNYWCVKNVNQCQKGVAPITPYDVVAGFSSRTPFFYGLDTYLMRLFEGNTEITSAARNARTQLFHVDENSTVGSNAIAVAPSRSTDGHTRLMVNSHQPYVGPVAWYEARLKSEEGWDIIGGVFPGSPVVLHGTNRNLGWAHTVNKPDLVDVYKLTVDNEGNPKQYLMDGEWRDFEFSRITFRVKLVGPFSLPVTRKSFRSIHGPAFVTDHGVYAVSYAGAGNIQAVEQWYHMNKADDLDGWLSAMEILAVPSFNSIYADRWGNIGYFYNAAIPLRSENFNWNGILPGDKSEAVWKGTRSFYAAPNVINPDAGYVINANNSPFESSAPSDSPNALNYPPHFGIDTKTTNRGMRLRDLYGSDENISKREFIQYKMDHNYAAESRVMEFVQSIITTHSINNNDPEFVALIEILKNWNGSADADNRSAALAILSAQEARGYLLDDEAPANVSYEKALRDTGRKLRSGFGRPDPRWGDVVRLVRGDLNLELNGGPDTLRAVYTSGDPADGPVLAAGGDTYILYTEWSPSGDQSIMTIHQFGSATLDKNSIHYNNQAALFAQEQWKSPPMNLEALLSEATNDYLIGKREDLTEAQSR